MNRRWICGDVWMDILPSFDRPQLGLNLALLSDRFDVLVDTHFDGQTTELTIWRIIKIQKGKGPKAKLSVWIDGKFVDFPLPDLPLPNKIRFKDLRIEYIDYSVIEFVRSNKHIWDRSGTKLGLELPDFVQPIWDVFVRQIWPFFETNIRHLCFTNGYHLNNLRHRTSPTILTDLDQLNSIDTDGLFPGAAISAGQALSNWLHSPTKNGQPKRFRCIYYSCQPNDQWVKSFKKAFASATASVSYKIKFKMYKPSIETKFELVNERTKEKLTLMKDDDIYWLLKRCPISEKAAAVQWENDGFWDDKLNKVTFNLWVDINGPIGPLSPPAEEKEEADKSNEN